MKKALSLIFTVVMCLSLCACGNKATPEMIDAYKNANACLSQGRYEEAAKLYIEADNYEDAEEKLLEIYYYAVNCYEKGSAEGYALPLVNRIIGTVLGKLLVSKIFCNFRKIFLTFLAECV